MSGLNLTLTERLVLYGWRVCSWRMLLVLACTPLILWIYLRLRYPSVGGDSATLFDPERLRNTIAVFASTPTLTASQSERHRTESLCRSMLERMLGMKLPKIRPKWLVNPTTKRSLELDLYNEEHRIAFEYDGAQHATYTPHYHNNEYHFEYRRLLDKLKEELCRDAGVLLIRIPWNEVALHDKVRTAQYLERLLTHHGIPYQSILETDTVSRAPPDPPAPANRSPLRSSPAKVA